MNERIGVTVGKFMPLHKGHVLMIESAARVLDRLYVIVSGTEDQYPSIEKRYKSIYAKYNKMNNIVVVKHIDNIGDDWKKDENGTVINAKFWLRWIKVLNELAPDATHFVSSDKYGKKAADLLGIEWLPIDPDRTIFPISGTDIRAEPNVWYNPYIDDNFKKFYHKSIAIVGPESTGKTILSDHLANHFNAELVPEFGRTLSEAKNNDLDEQNFKDIFEIQSDFIFAAEKAGPVSIIDTEAITTYLFLEKYLKRDDFKWALRFYTMLQDIDFYLVMGPSVPWIDDGYRVIPDQYERVKFFQDIITILEEYNKKYVIIDDDNYDTRQVQAEIAIEQFLGIKR